MNRNQVGNYFTDCNGSCLKPPQGLGFCTSQLSASCCNFYAGNNCTTSCAGNMTDASFNCREFQNKYFIGSCQSISPTYEALNAVISE